MGFVGNFSLNHKFHQTCWHLRRSAVLRILSPHLLPLWRRSSESRSHSKPGAIISGAEAPLMRSTLLCELGPRSKPLHFRTATLRGYTLLAFWAKAFVNMWRRCSMRFGNVLVIVVFFFFFLYTHMTSSQSCRQWFVNVYGGLPGGGRAFMFATIAMQNLGGISWSRDTKNKCYVLFGVCWLSFISTFRNISDRFLGVFLVF